MKTTITLLTASLLLITIVASSVSLWDDRSADIYNRRINYRQGDSVSIIINEKSSYQYKSSTKSLKSYKIDISGGELSGLFTFLPTGNAEENKSSTDNDNLSINTAIEGTIEAVSDNYLTITGRKQITVNNKVSIVTITGNAHYSNIKNNSINYTNLVNPTLNVTTLLQSSKQVVNNNDLVQVILNPDATTDIILETQISEARKRQILIDYFNKILNVVF